MRHQLIHNHIFFYLYYNSKQFHVMKQTNFLSATGNISFNQQLKDNSIQNLCKNMLECNYACCEEKNEGIFHPQYILQARKKKTFYKFASGSRKESLRQYSKKETFHLNKQFQDHKILLQGENKKILNHSHQYMVQSQVYLGSPKKNLMKFNNYGLKDKKSTMGDFKNKQPLNINSRHRVHKLIPEIYSESSSSNYEYSSIVQPKANTIIRSLINQQQYGEKSKRQRESEEFTFIKKQKNIPLELQKKQQSLKNLTQLKIVEKPFIKNHSYSFESKIRARPKKNIKSNITKIKEVSKREQEDEFLFQKIENNFYSQQLCKNDELSIKKHQNCNSNCYSLQYNQQSTPRIQRAFDINCEQLNSKKLKIWQNLGDQLVFNQTRSTTADNVQSSNTRKSFATIENKYASHQNLIKQNNNNKIKSHQHVCISSQDNSNNNPISIKNSFGSSFNDISCRSKIRSIGNTLDSNFEINKIVQPMSTHYFHNEIQSINQLVPYYVQSIVTSKNHNNQEREFSQVLINYLRKANSPPMINVQKRDSTGSIEFGIQKILKNQGQNKQHSTNNTHMQKSNGFLLLHNKQQK